MIRNLLTVTLATLFLLTLNATSNAQCSGCQMSAAPMSYSYAQPMVVQQPMMMYQQPMAGCCQPMNRCCQPMVVQQPMCGCCNVGALDVCRNCSGLINCVRCCREEGNEENCFAYCLKKDVEEGLWRCRLLRRLRFRRCCW